MMEGLVYVVSVWLLVVGIVGVVRSAHLIHIAGCMGVAQSATYVMLIGAGWRVHGKPPIFEHGDLAHAAVDPIVQSLTLTDIVVGATFLALLLALSVQTYKRFGTLHPRGLRDLRG